MRIDDLLCDYSHDNIYHLYRHIKSHNGEIPEAKIINNIRPLCKPPSKYKQMYNEEDKTFSCPICNKKYNYRQSMQVHIKTHDKKRTFKFQCSECDFKCDHKGQFKRHINKHI